MTATSVESEIQASRTALVKRTATATPTALPFTTELPSPTATDDTVEPTETSQRDIRASRTPLVKRTATASPTKTKVPLSTATDEVSRTAASVEREIRVSRTALAKRTTTSTISAATAASTAEASPTPGDATKGVPPTTIGRTAVVEVPSQTPAEIGAAFETAEKSVTAGVPETVTKIPVTVTKSLPASSGLTPTADERATEAAIATKAVSMDQTATRSTNVTEIDPVQQPTATPTIQPSATASMLPFVYSRLVPTPTAVGFVRAIEPETCEVAADWQSYQVAVGDTLLAIAESINISLVEIQEGNCFEPIRGVLAGESLLLPATPSVPPATAIPVYPNDNEPPEVIGCDTEAAQIISPVAMQEIRGIIEVIGSVGLHETSLYRLDIRPAWSDKYFEYLEGYESVSSDVLGLLNSEVFGIGLHRLRISIVDRAGQPSTDAYCDIPVLFLAL